MVAKLYTDDELTALREMPKEVTNPRARWSEKPKSNPSHLQRTFLVLGRDDKSMRFQVYNVRTFTTRMIFLAVSPITRQGHCL